eukprot:7461615-Prorocentrum_lima.AAC.1
MTSSLVGSEMCIRDRIWKANDMTPLPHEFARGVVDSWKVVGSRPQPWACLLYTSDAADDM